MKNLHYLNNWNIPEDVKTIAIAWNVQGYTELHPLFYNLDTKDILYRYLNTDKLVRFGNLTFKSWAERTRMGRKFTPDMITVVRNIDG